MAAPQTPIDSHRDPDQPAQHRSEPRVIFGAPADGPNPGSGILVWASFAVLALILIAGGVFVRAHHTTPASAPNSQLPADPYATNLAFSQLAMSQSTSLSGGTSTFLDGHVRNNGPATLTGVTMQVIFRNDVGLSPQVEILPLSLIRTHEPYIDTEPVSAAPLKPGDEAEFRLVFEAVAGNWNQRMPELTAVRIARR